MASVGASADTADLASKGDEAPLPGFVAAEIEAYLRYRFQDAPPAHCR